MDASFDTSLTHGDTRQHTLAEDATFRHEHESNYVALDEDSIPGALPTSDLPSSPLIDGSEVRGGWDMNLLIKFDQESSDVQPAGNKFDHKHSCSSPQSDSSLAVPSAVPEKGLLLELPTCDSPQPVTMSDIEVPTFVYPQVPPLSCQRTISETIRRNERGVADSIDPLTCTPMLHAESDRIQAAGLIRPTGEEETQDVDYAHEHFPSSLPPSSSPPQLFSSSPCASSQSLASTEPPETMLATQVKRPANSPDCAHPDHMTLVTQDEPRVESEHHYNIAADVTTPPKPDRYLTSCSDGSPPSKKQMTSQRDADEPRESQSTKRPKLGSDSYLPPTPIRATLASQNRQFKKLAAPFRPPSKLPVARDEPDQTLAHETLESAESETGNERPNQRAPAPRGLSLQNKASSTSRSAAQFKSPLVNRVLPADFRTIRLTPAVQALERKLQLLKRAIKIRKDNEEQVLAKLARKWIEAGREVAYDVWDATKDAGDAHRSDGWKSASDGNTSWGWETKLGDASEDSCDGDPSMTPEEDEEVGFNNTLGTMLRQLGIAPEIFGWDDDKETFCD